MTYSKAIFPGMTVKVVDKKEPSSEWVEFTVIEQRGKRVDLFTPSGEKTWARLDEIFLPNSGLLAPTTV
jgi:hypothetical protein